MDASRDPWEHIASRARQPSNREGLDWPQGYQNDTRIGPNISLTSLSGQSVPHKALPLPLASNQNAPRQGPASPSSAEKRHDKCSRR